MGQIWASIVACITLAVAGFGQATTPTQDNQSVQKNAVPESAEHKLARVKVEEATKRCTGLQSQFDAIDFKLNQKAIQDLAASGYPTSPYDQPAVTTCMPVLQERSEKLVTAERKHNDLIEEAHQAWLQHSLRMIGLGAKPTPERNPGEKVPESLLKELSEIAQAHDTIAAAMPLLEARVDHADDCAGVYRKTIDLKVADMTNCESDQVKGCKEAGLYPPDK